MNRPNTVSVDMLDKEYQVACPPDEETALADAARYLDQHMRDIRSTGKVVGLELHVNLRMWIAIIIE